MCGHVETCLCNPSPVTSPWTAAVQIRGGQIAGYRFLGGDFATLHEVFLPGKTSKSQTLRGLPFFFLNNEFNL